MRCTSRTALTAGTLAVLALAVPAAQARSLSLAASGAARLSAATSVTTQGVVYTANTVVIPQALAASQLASVSADGSTYTFKSASGPLATLKAGSVMFLQGKSVASVTSVGHAGSQLIVHTAPASLPDFIQSGNIAVDAPVSFAAGTIDPEPGTVEPEITVEAIRRAVAAGAVAQAAGDTGTTYSGDVHGLQYNATLDRGSERLDFTVDYKYDKDGMIGTIDSTGYLDSFDAHMAMYVKNDLVHSSSFLAKPLDGHVHIDWSLGRGPDAKETLKVPVLTLPFSWDIPFIAGGFPFFLKVQFELKLTVAFTAKNGTMSGGVDLNYSGDGGGTSVAASLNPQGSGHIAGNFETPHALTLGASAAVIAIEFPKLVLGMGFSALNGNGWIGVITAIGQTTGSLVAGQACSSYDLDVSVKAGLGAAIFKTIPKALLPSKTIYDKSAHYAQPGC